MAKLMLIKEAIENGKNVLDNVAGMYDSAMSVYGAFDGATEFEQRNRSLELVIVNGTEHELRFNDEHFDSGTWFTSPKPLNIQSGDVSIAFVANRQGSVLTGVTGGMKYEIVGTGKYLLMGFTNPQVGSYKNFIAVGGNDRTAQWAYDNSFDDSVKNEYVDGYHLTCTLHEGSRTPYRRMQYAINQLE